MHEFLPEPHASPVRHTSQASAKHDAASRSVVLGGLADRDARQGRRVKHFWRRKGRDRDAYFAKE
ncbi:hypothetical protein PSPO01_08743 [Paraphaeosphaeria sporulosa]